jgi:hypothetical protein
VVKRRRESKEATAIHEAGHAVTGRVLTLKCGGATIKPNYRTRSAGQSICVDPWGCIYEWEKRGHVRESDNAVWVARIMTYMAGAEANVELLGMPRSEIGDYDDQYQIALMMEQASPPGGWDRWTRERYDARLRAMTRMLVRRHRERIERVAKALLKETILSAEKLDALVGRSIDDVKVNAPDLIALHRRHRRRS